MEQSYRKGTTYRGQSRAKEQVALAATHVPLCALVTLRLVGTGYWTWRDRGTAAEAGSVAELSEASVCLVQMR